MAQIRMAQYGTKHGHAGGKFMAMQSNAEVEVAGVFEPDAERRRQVEADGLFQGAHFFADKGELLQDDSIVAIASEGGNAESLDQTEEIVAAGKHVWYDKPAGDDWAQWQRVVERAQEQDLLIQMGYMFRYHDGFQHIARWARSGMLGDIFAVRAHMSTSVGPESVQFIGRNHRGGIFYDLSGHMLDQVVWLLGRPDKVTSFLRNDTGLVPEFADNNLGVFEYENALAFVDIAAMETPPTARRFEVYGTRGSAIMQPLDEAEQVRLNVPPLTTERRQELSRVVRRYGEDAKVTIRQHRRDANELLAAGKKDGDIPEDDAHRGQQKVQESTDTFVARIDEIIEEKEREIMED